MTHRLFAIPVLVAAIALTPAAIAQTGEAEVSPEVAEPRQGVPRAELRLENLREEDPFYFGLDYRGIAADAGAPDPRWYERQGIDSPFDVDPRGQFYLPQPEPGLTIDLR